MASVTYTQVLHDIDQLTPDEQQQLLKKLMQRTTHTTDALEVLREQESHKTSLTDQQRDDLDAWFARADAIAKEVSAHWDDPTISAVDAVREQRKDLCSLSTRV